MAAIALMPLTINSHLEDGFAVLDLAGSLTLSPSLSTLRDGAKKLLGLPRLSGIILRVSEVTQTDSAGLGELTAVYSLAMKQGCPIRLVEVTSHLRKMLEMTRLDALLPSAKDVATAKEEMKEK
jgi:anti-anti-sigma factor